METQVVLPKIQIYNPRTEQTKRNIEKTANTSDLELTLISAKKAKKEASKKPSAKLSKAVFPATIAALCMARGAGIKSPTGKAIAAGVELAGLGLMAASYNGAKALTDKVANNTDTPEAKGATKAIGYIGGSLIIYDLVQKGIFKSINSLVNKFPQKTEDLCKKFAENASKIDGKITGSNVAKAFKKVGEPLKKIAGIIPQGVKTFTGKHRFGLIVAAGILTSIGLQAKQDKNEAEAFIKNFNELSSKRNEARQAALILNEAEFIHNSQKEKTVDITPIIEAAIYNDDINEGVDDSLKFAKITE